MSDIQSSIAYLSTLGAIVLLCVLGAAVCIFAQVNSEVSLARVIGALSFIGAGVSGLIGVIGTFRPRQQGSTVEQAGTVNQ